MYRFRVVLFGSTENQFLLSSTIKHHLKKYNNETSTSICRNIYVDDLHFTNDSETNCVIDVKMPAKLWLKVAFH